ncbi:MAG: MGMT family protein [Bacteroidota bacterium]|nr:MGMT family protein [Bacteroidota bacterium]
MAAKKKSWTEKLLDAKDLPRVVDLSKTNSRWGKGTMYIPAPVEVDALMKKVKKGKLTTINNIRKKLATTHHTDIACPLTTGIFSWIAANAANEREQSGKKSVTPYWRTLKEKGIINPKYPGGETLQKKILESEGFKVTRKGKHWIVQDFEKFLS